MSNPGIENIPAPVVDNSAPVQAPVAPAVEVAQVVAPVVEAPPAPVVAPVEAPVVPEVKPAETVLAAEIDKNKPPVEANKTEGGQSAEPAPPPKEEVAPTEIVKPTYADFVLPEGSTLDKDRISQFTDILADLELKGKADHGITQEIGQKLVDFHVNEVKQVADNYTKMLTEAWGKQKNDWKEAFLADPEIGGNRFQTTVDSALSFIRTHGGTNEQQAEIRNLMESSGLGNNGAIIRLFANAGRAMSEGRPLAAVNPVPTPRSKTATLYGKSN